MAIPLKHDVRFCAPRAVAGLLALPSRTALAYGADRLYDHYSIGFVAASLLLISCLRSVDSAALP